MVVPNSIQPVSERIESVVRSYFPNVIDIDDFGDEADVMWAKCGHHELFHQDANRFINDVYQDHAKGRRTFFYGGIAWEKSRSFISY